MSDVIIRTHELEYIYDSDDVTPEKALDGIDLSFTRGSFTAILGHNGCGKSTFAKHMNALLLPTGGKVFVGDRDTADEEQHLEIRRTVGMVLQNPDNQLVSTIVEEDVAFGPENLGIPPKEIRKRVDAALNAVGMYDYRHHAAHKLSGGQKQRIAIAGVLAMEPDVLVLDEPTAMLDPQGRAEVMDTILRLNRERGMTVLLITHFMEEAVKADRVVVMEQGVVVADGTPRDIFSDVEKLREVALDVPQATDLCFKLRRLGIPVADNVLTEEEAIETLSAVLEEFCVNS